MEIMTVKELIKKLKEMPEDKIVWLKINGLYGKIKEIKYKETGEFSSVYIEGD